MHRNIAWDKVENPNPRSTPQVPPSFEETALPVTYPDEVDETIGTLIEVEPLDETQLDDLGSNTYNHDIPFSSREVPSFNEASTTTLTKLSTFRYKSRRQKRPRTTHTPSSSLVA
ncbi:hypothetical protein Tco_0108313, partial [Tanacetum coccineum]